MLRQISTILVVSLLCLKIISIQIPMHYGPRCMIMQAQFQPIKLQLKLPKVPNAKGSQKYRIVLLDLLNQEIQFETYLEQEAIFRKNIKLLPSIICWLSIERLYHLCIYVTGSRAKFNENTEQFYVGYVADEDFDTLIGNIQIPQELQGEENLQYIYNVSKSIDRINKKIISHQSKEREIEDSLTTSNLHKNQRIISLTLIQCLVIVLSGVYQVFALRKFLIDKNLY